MSEMLTRAVIIGGETGLFMRASPGKIDRFLRGLIDKPVARVCIIPTASGDKTQEIADFVQAYQELDCQVFCLPVFFPSWDDIVGRLASMDLIYIGGGNTKVAWAAWQTYRDGEVIRAIRHAYKAGVVIAGQSAGGLLMCSGGTTDSDGLGQAKPLSSGVGLRLLPFSHCPHYSAEKVRRPAYHATVAAGTVGDGLAVDDAAAVLIEDGAIKEVVTCESDETAYWVSRGDMDDASESRYESRLLP